MANLTMADEPGLGLAWAGVWGAGVSMIDVSVVKEMGILVEVEVAETERLVGAAWEEFGGWEEELFEAAVEVLARRKLVRELGEEGLWDFGLGRRGPQGKVKSVEERKSGWNLN